MNTKLIDSLIAIINSLTEEERKNLEEKLHPKIESTVINSLNLKEEPFIGMWRDHKEMQDSSQWVCHLRHKEWMT